VVAAAHPIDWYLALGAVIGHEGNVDERYYRHEAQREAPRQRSKAHRALQLRLFEDAAALRQVGEAAARQWTALYILALSQVDIEHLLAEGVGRGAVERRHHELGVDCSALAHWAFDSGARPIRHVLNGSEQVLLPALSAEFVGVARRVQSLAVQEQQAHLAHRLAGGLQANLHRIVTDCAHRFGRK